MQRAPIGALCISSCRGSMACFYSAPLAWNPTAVDTRPRQNRSSAASHPAEGARRDAIANGRCPQVQSAMAAVRIAACNSGGRDRPANGASAANCAAIHGS
jgi:hypothetical protein